MIFEVHTIPCMGCGSSTTFTMSEEQFNRFRAGEHAQRIFPAWSPEDRELLISGTCPSCWEEMWAEEEDEEDWVYESMLDPESDYPEYESDYYVDRDCD